MRYLRTSWTVWTVALILLVGCSTKRHTLSPNSGSSGEYSNLNQRSFHYDTKQIPVSTKTYGDFEFKIVDIPATQGEARNPAYFVASKGGKQIFRQEGWHLYFGHMYNMPFDNLIPIGKDITGRGFPEIAISEYTGGAHCCLNVYVYEIQDDLRPVDMIEAEHGDLSHFEDVNHDGRLEFVTQDWAFAYWNTSFAQSPAPEIVLHFEAGKYSPALDLMRRPRPSDDSIKKLVTEIKSERAWREGKPPVLLWRTMLELIYSGNNMTAWDIFENSWPLEVPGKDGFKKEFLEQLSKSKYWHAIRTLVAS